MCLLQGHHVRVWRNEVAIFLGKTSWPPLQRRGSEQKTLQLVQDDQLDMIANNFNCGSAIPSYRARNFLRKARIFSRLLRANIQSVGADISTGSSRLWAHSAGENAEAEDDCAAVCSYSLQLSSQPSSATVQVGAEWWEFFKIVRPSQYSSEHYLTIVQIPWCARGPLMEAFYAVVVQYDRRLTHSPKYIRQHNWESLDSFSKFDLESENCCLQPTQSQSSRWV